LFLQYRTLAKLKDDESCGDGYTAGEFDVAAPLEEADDAYERFSEGRAQGDVGGRQSRSLYLDTEWAQQASQAASRGLDSNGAPRHKTLNVVIQALACVRACMICAGVPRISPVFEDTHNAAGGQSGGGCTRHSYSGLTGLRDDDMVEPLERPGKLAPTVHRAMTQRLLCWAEANPGIPIPPRAYTHARTRTHARVMLWKGPCSCRVRACVPCTLVPHSSSMAVAVPV
jgi:hypothetical protein